MLSGVEIGAPVVRVRTNVWLQLTPQSRPKVRWKTIAPSPTVGCSGTGDVNEWKDKCQELHASTTARKVAQSLDVEIACQ